MVEVEDIQEKKMAKIAEYKDLIAQYEAGERENINVSEYPKWILVCDMLKDADIDEKEFDAFIANPSHYKVVDKQIVFNPDWEQEEKQAEEERIAKLHMTKLDFFTYVLKPYGITYSALQDVLKTNDDLKATFELCNHVYRGDATLNKFIFEQIPSLTAEELTNIFEAHSVAD